PFPRTPTPPRLPNNRFDPPNSSCDRLFLYDPEWADLARRSDVGSTTQFHRITVERARSTTDLQNAHAISVFLAEELDDVFALFGVCIRNFSPGNRRIFRDLFVNQFFNIEHLLLRQWRA